MTTSELAKEVFSLIEAKIRCTASPIEFEMAYQARVAIEKIRFAVKQTGQLGPRTGQMQEVEFQLLDALQRLENIDRRFQQCSGSGSVSEYENPPAALQRGCEKQGRPPQREFV